MKTLKEFRKQIDLAEAQIGEPIVTPGNPDGAIDDGSILPSNLEDPTVLAKINGFVGAIAQRSYVNADIPVRYLQNKLSRIGLWFNYKNEFGGVINGKLRQVFPLVRHGGKTGFIGDADGVPSTNCGFMDNRCFSLVITCQHDLVGNSGYCLGARIVEGAPHELVNLDESNAVTLKEEPDWKQSEKPQFPFPFWMAIRQTERAYGGPEEGGWYYDRAVYHEDIKQVKNETEYWEYIKDKADWWGLRLRPFGLPSSWNSSDATENRMIASKNRPAESKTFPRPSYE